MNIEHIYQNEGFDKFQEVTTLKENQLYWLDYIVSSMEKRRVAEILFSKGYSIEDVEDVLVLADTEVNLIKDHIEKYGTIEIEYILKALTLIYRRETLEMIVERLLDKEYDKNVIEDVIQLFKE